MMEIVVSLTLAFILIGGLIPLVGGRRDVNVWPVLVLFFLAIWAGGLWLTPIGPSTIGVYWMPFLFVAIFIALFWIAAPPPPKRTNRAGEPTTTSAMQENDPAVTTADLGVLFWILLVALAIAALARYTPMVAPVAQAS
ncbi:MAG: hypothetical protein P0121_08875 [Nitrospira sp.]|nr:hypothetical protein [Nitrospira sp.]